MKKILSKQTITELLALLLLLISMGAQAAPQQIGNSTTYWEIVDGVLEITGTGAIPDFASANDSPWYVNRFSIIAIDINAGVTSIGKNAFKNCTSVVTVDMPQITSIGESAFYSCNKLPSIIMPKVITIGDYAFRDCSILDAIAMPEATSIGSNAFYACGKLPAISMPKVITIGSNAFANCGAMSTITMPVVTTIGVAAFSSCVGISTVDLPKTTTIGDRAFFYCKELRTINMPLVTTIGDAVFSSCTMLSTVTMPKVITIGEQAFASCIILASIDIPATTTSIGEKAFNGSFRLKKVTLLPTTPPAVSENSFLGVHATAEYLVLAEAAADYLAHPVWGNLNIIISDTEPPTISNTTITVGTVTATSIEISWTKATDNVTPQSELMYRVFWGTSSDALAADFNSYTITGLTSNTDYYVLVEVSDEVGNTAQYEQTKVTTIYDVGIEELGLENGEWKIYPNPTSDKLRIESGEWRISEVEIYGMNGRVVKRIDNPSSEIDVSDLQQGIYFLKIKTEKGEVVRKFIKN